MADKRPPYHRRTTKPIPRAKLPPPATNVPDEAAKHWDPNAITQEVCPCCASCSLCGGKGMVPGEIAQAYREQIRSDEEDDDA